MRLIVIYAITLHFIWFAAILIDPQAANATAMFTAHVVGPYWAALTYVAVAIFAWVSMGTRGVIRPLLLLPQQAVMCVSALEASKAMLLGHFADGVMRSHWFIIADQSPAVLAMILHTWAIIVITQRELRWTSARRF